MMADPHSHALLQALDLRTGLFGPISLMLAASECVSIRGASGSGKSLFLRALADLDPNEGEARLNGIDRCTMPADRWRRRVAMVPAESGWWSDRVADHFGSADASAPWLAAVGLPDALDWQVSRLSTGERQRLALARALCGRPEVLLLDEPTAALDAEATERVEDLMRDHCARGGAVLLVTHDPAQARRVATRHFRMEQGRLHPDEAGAS